MNGAQALKTRMPRSRVAKNLPQMIEPGLSVELYIRSTLWSERSAPMRTAA